MPPGLVVIFEALFAVITTVLIAGAVAEHAEVDHDLGGSPLTPGATSTPEHVIASAERIAAGVGSRTETPAG